jgi:hypothetical protein
MMMSMSNIRRHKDGSIDTGFYVAIGNRERGRIMRAFWARLFGKAGRPKRPVEATRRMPHHGIAAGH